MRAIDIQPGNTYRSRVGWDYRVLSIIDGNVNYEVRTGKWSGKSGVCHVYEFAPRVVRATCLREQPVRE